MAAALTCPYCSHAIVFADDETNTERCPSCQGELLLAYRYQLIRARGEVAGGVLYEAIDAGFAQSAAVLFIKDPNDKPAVERFVAGHRLFANLRVRGLVGIHEVSRPTHARPYVVMDWLAGSTLDRVVGKSGAFDPQLVWTMTSSLLIGLERAHRALPALVHGQVHPGKIGFRKPVAEGGPALLFGFEWARLVSEQDSSLADSFSADAGVEVERASSLDLRGLARSIVYAATGQWIEDGTRERQRQQAAALMPGPMAPFIDRLIAAGTPDGYNSTSVARDEFELIRAGGERRRHRGPPTAQHAAFTAPPSVDLLEPGIPDDDDEDDDADHDDMAPTRPSNSVGIEQLRAQQQALLAARAAAAASSSSGSAAASNSSSGSGGKVGVIAFFMVAGVAMFGSIFLSAMEDTEVANAPNRGVASPVPDWSEPMPTPPMVEPPLDPPSVPEPTITQFAARGWSAKVENTIKGGPIKAGAKCELWVSPQPEGSPFNCRWMVDCKERSGWTRYYGNDETGLGTCEFEADELVYFADFKDEDGDGLMVFDARGEQPWVLFGERHANPARAVLMRLQGEAKLAEQPKHADSRPLVRRPADEVGDDEHRAAGLEIDRLAASVGFELDLVADEPSEALPETLDIFALQSTIDGIQADLLGCPAPEGTRVEVELKLDGATGFATEVSLTNTVDGGHDICLRAILATTEFDRFSDESMTVNWTIAY